MHINTKTITEQHATWIVSNPIIGCPKNCAYCFLKPAGLNSVSPRQLQTSKQAVGDLLKSKYYRPDAVVAIGTRTDMLATPSNIKYLKKYSIEFNKRGLKNPLVVLTKHKITDDFIKFAQRLESKGTKFLFYLSYSGLDSNIEKGVTHKDIKNNFPRLHSAGLKIIHYWRPFIPQNSTPEIMSRVINHVVKYSCASVIAGLRMTPEMKKQFWFWSDIQDVEINFDFLEGVWPAHVKNYLEKYYAEKYPEYPIYYSNSCAIAYALKTVDYNGFYGSGVCTSNSCPKEQRDRCKKFFENYRPSQKDIQDAVKSIRKNINLKWDPRHKFLKTNKKLDHGEIVYLTQKLKAPIKVREVKEGGYGWGSSVTGRKPLFIPINFK